MPKNIVSWRINLHSSGCTDSNSVSHILCKENALELDDEKVDQLFNILQ